MRLPFLRSKAPGGQPRRKLLARGSAPVAVDFGRRSVRLLQLAAGEQAYACRAAAEIPGWVLTAPGSQHGAGAGDVTARLHDVMMQCRFGNTLCHISLPAELFQCDTARLPVMPDAELMQSVQFEATDRFGIDPATTVLGHARLGEVQSGQQEVLIMALPRATVEAAVTPVMAAGLGSLHLEHAAFAALRAIRRQRDHEVADRAQAGNFALVHIEDRVATLILVRDSAPTLLRSMAGNWAPANTTIHRVTPPTPVPGSLAVGAAPEQADDTPIAIDPAPASAAEAPESVSQDPGSQAAWRWCGLADEALRCLRHLERTLNGWSPSTIVVTGPAACDPQVVASMESVCGIRAELAVPIRLVDSPAPCVHGNPWVATIGAALAHLPPLAVTAEPPVAPPPRKAAPATHAGELTRVKGAAA